MNPFAEFQVSTTFSPSWISRRTELLLVLRSRLLFASTPEVVQEADQDAARKLARLRELQFVKAASAWLDARPRLGRDVFGRPWRERDPRVASYMRQMEACLTVLRDRAGEGAQDEPVYRPAISDLYLVPAAIAHLRTLLGAAEGPQPLRAFLPRLPEDARAKPVIACSAIASTFVAAFPGADGLAARRPTPATIGLRHRADPSGLVSDRQSAPHKVGGLVSAERRCANPSIHVEL